MIVRHITPRVIVRRSLEQTVVDESLVTDVMVDRYWELLRITGNRQAMIDLTRQRDDRGVWRRLSEISVPTLIIWGEQDRLLPVSMLDGFQQRMTHAKVRRLPNVGHLPMEEATTVVAREILSFCAVERC